MDKKNPFPECEIDKLYETRVSMSKVAGNIECGPPDFYKAFNKLGHSKPNGTGKSDEFTIAGHPDHTTMIRLVEELRKIGYRTAVLGCVEVSRDSSSTSESIPEPV